MSFFNFYSRSAASEALTSYLTRKESYRVGLSVRFFFLFFFLDVIYASITLVPPIKSATAMLQILVRLQEREETVLSIHGTKVLSLGGVHRKKSIEY